MDRREVVLLASFERTAAAELLERFLAAEAKRKQKTETSCGYCVGKLAKHHGQHLPMWGGERGFH